LGRKNYFDDDFTLTKRKNNFLKKSMMKNKFDLIYFDFGYRVQPELWSTAIFEKMYNALKPNGVLVTYAARGVVKKEHD
jgi:tRNA U34 5-methylaminomethyl-2-thiouridine-forming methyltransferase MnmC